MTEQTYNNLCDVDTFTSIIDNINYFEAEGNIRAVEVFKRLRQEAIEKCGFVIRQLDKRMYKKEQKRTMIGFQEYIINDDGSLSIPDPPPKQPEVQRAFSEVEIMIMNREQEDKKPKKKSFEAERRWL